MNWYLAKIVFRIVCGEGHHTAQFDEQLRLIKAEDECSALEKAKDIGRKEQDCFFNQRQQLVQWQFINVSELLPVDTTMDGAEVYSKINETENPEAYIKFVEDKAAQLQKEGSLFKSILV